MVIATSRREELRGGMSEARRWMMAVKNFCAARQVKLAVYIGSDNAQPHRQQA